MCVFPSSPQHRIDNTSDCDQLSEPKLAEQASVTAVELIVYFRQQTHLKEKADQIYSDWLFIGTVIDRFFLLSTTVFIAFVIVPNFISMLE